MSKNQSYTKRGPGRVHRNPPFKVRQAMVRDAVAPPPPLAMTAIFGRVWAAARSLWAKERA